MRCFAPSLLLPCALLLAGCHTVPETGRSAFTLMPESQVAGMATETFEEVKQTEPLIESGERYERIQRVGRRVAGAVGGDAPGAQWEFIYIDDDQVNAWAMPGGKVAVYDGLFDVVESEDELAFILSHEVAHVTARHANQRLSSAMVIAGLGLGVSLASQDMDRGDRELLLAAYGIGSTLGVALPYSRFQESEADYIGLMYMARAGYNPRVAPAVWQKMGETGKDKPPAFLSTHPSDASRKAHLEEAMPRAIQLYNQAIHEERADPRARDPAPRPRNGEDRGVSDFEAFFEE